MLIAIASSSPGQMFLFIKNGFPRPVKKMDAL
jgi:hypothetical protein